MKNKDFKTINDLIHRYSVHNSSHLTMVCDKSLLIDFKKLMEAYEDECVKTGQLQRKIHEQDVMIEDLMENARHE